MVEWIDVSTLAEVAGLTKRSIQQMALRFGWPFREVSCRGGLRRQYAVSALPPEMQRKVEAYFARQQAEEERRLQEVALQEVQAAHEIDQAETQEAARAAAHQAALDRVVADATALAAQEKEREQIRLARHQESLAKFPQLPQWQQRYALAKWEIIKAYEAFTGEGHYPRTVGQELFINEYNVRRIEVPEPARAIYSEVCLSSLRRWIDEEYKHGLIGLIDMYGYRKGFGRIDQDPQLEAGHPGLPGQDPPRPAHPPPAVDPRRPSPVPGS